MRLCSFPQIQLEILGQPDDICAQGLENLIERQRGANLLAFFSL